jgi:hypothetical protein
MFLLRFLALVVILNILRYAGGALIEPFVIFPGLSAAMEESASYFNSVFETFDWATSFFYNFMMWLSCAWVFHLMRPAIKGSDLVASFKVFGIMCLFFASISAILMNHYSHPKDFYFWIILDGVLMYALVAVCNGLLYRRVMGAHAAAGAACGSGFSRE